MMWFMNFYNWLKTLRQHYMSWDQMLSLNVQVMVLQRAFAKQDLISFAIRLSLLTRLQPCKYKCFYDLDIFENGAKCQR